VNDIILKTERLQLRHQRDDDLGFMIKLWTDREVTKYAGGPRDKNTLVKSFNDTASDPGGEEYDLWYVELTETKELIGMAGLLLKEIENEQFYEVNYYIEEKHRNKGYATEIANGIIVYFMENNNIQTFIAIIDKENIPSIKVAEKTGMTYWKSELRVSGKKEIYKSNVREV